MKISFDHIKGFGKVKHSDITHAEACGTLENTDNIDEVLNQGWIPWFENHWYNVRSVRINLDEYKPSHKTKKRSKKIECGFSEISTLKDRSDAHRIYDIYVKTNGFDGRIDIDRMIDACQYYLKLTCDNKVVAYTFLDMHEQSMVSCQFIYDFSCGNLSVGSISQYYECLKAKELGKKYVYILSGYEEVCLYKAKIYGMEWWTGKEWSQDYDLYAKLCKRDSSIEVINYDDI